MYRYFIESESLVVSNCTEKEWNIYPLEKAVCERQLAKQLKVIASVDSRKVIRYWIEEVTK